ncbi:hypothetical protein [Photobacterium carnosum]|uniref:hypothetical protein n=1 Tax=Photobacterium carnosum TaxID=2023717 RepID=UPI001E425CD3|nr:hypothetical protein [Photobacterium carnosum]MCD9536495.1 hypothetical protein [Photobacterium carnosum]MCF2161056.1 hypothetical protein [Photobacterium carnosum]
MVSILKRICNYFDSSKLTKDLTFVGIGVTGIFISGVSTAAISNSFNGELTQCYTPQCFDNLLNWFSFPLKTLTATAAIMGIVAMVHRSKQTATQIELSTKQIQTTINHNMHLNYFSHLKEFKERINFLDFEHLEIVNLNTLYKEIYPSNTPNYFNHIGNSQPLLGRVLNGLKNAYLEISSLNSYLYNNENILRYKPTIADNDAYYVANALSSYQQQITTLFKSLGVLVNWNNLEKQNPELLKNKSIKSNGEIVGFYINIDNITTPNPAVFDGISHEINSLLDCCLDIAMSETEYPIEKKMLLSTLMPSDINLYYITEELIKCIDTLNGKTLENIKQDSPTLSKEH